MTEIPYGLLEWLGPAADELAPDQIERVVAASAEIDARYPDPDESDMRHAALSAVVQHLLRETSADDANRALIAARSAEARAYAAALQIAVELVRDGEPKATAARRAGVDRMSLLGALGER